MEAEIDLHGPRSVATFQHYTIGIAGSIITVIGLLGNIISLIVLLQRPLKTSMYTFLVNIAIIDLLILTVWTIQYVVPYIPSSYEDQIRIFQTFEDNIIPYTYPIGLILQTAGIWTTVAITVDRYIYICKPERAITMCRVSRARKISLGIVFAAIIFNVPRFFYFQMESRVINGTTEELLIKTKIDTKLFRQINNDYLYIPFVIAFPFLLISVFNVYLIKAIVTSEKIRTRIAPWEKRVSMQAQGNTIMLVGILISFLVSNIPTIIINILMASQDLAQLYSSEYFHKLKAISHLLVLVNSTINIMFFCFFGQTFRDGFKTLVHRIVPRYFCQMEGVASTQGNALPYRNIGNIVVKNNMKLYVSSPTIIITCSDLSRTGNNNTPEKTCSAENNKLYSCGNNSQNELTISPNTSTISTNTSTISPNTSTMYTNINSNSDSEARSIRLSNYSNDSGFLTMSSSTYCALLGEMSVSKKYIEQDIQDINETLPLTQITCIHDATLPEYHSHI